MTLLSLNVGFDEHGTNLTHVGESFDLIVSNRSATIKVLV